MLVFWKEKLVLFAIPKTGTTALEGALAPSASMVMRDPTDLKHANVYRYQRFLVPLFRRLGQDDMETIAVIRQPVDRLGSWYRYRSRDDLAGHPNSTKGVTFDQFVAEYLKGKPAPYAALGSQARFLNDSDGNMAITHLFRYEALPKLVAFLEDRLKRKIVLPKVNVSPKMELTLDPGVEARLKRKHADEFAVWETAIS